MNFIADVFHATTELFVTDFGQSALVFLGVGAIILFLREISRLQLEGFSDDDKPTHKREAEKAKLL